MEHSMWSRMRAGELYRAEGAEIAAASARAQRLTHHINSTDPTEAGTLRELFTELLAEYGDGAEIRPPFHCDYGRHTWFGAGSFANFGLVVLDVADVVVGEDVQLGPRVQLLTATHPLEPAPRRDKWESARPVHVGDNVWLGGGVVVCPGVTIGADTVVGAGSVVTADLPPGVVALGTPARIVRSL